MYDKPAQDQGASIESYEERLLSHPFGRPSTLSCKTRRNGTVRRSGAGKDHSGSGKTLATMALQVRPALALCLSLRQNAHSCHTARPPTLFSRDTSTTQHDSARVENLPADRLARGAGGRARSRNRNLQNASPCTLHPNPTRSITSLFSFCFASGDVHVQPDCRSFGAIVRRPTSGFEKSVDIVGWTNVFGMNRQENLPWVQSCC